MDQGLALIPDKQLLAGCLSGDGHHQEAFVRQFSNLVFATIQRVGISKNARLSQQTIADLHQTVFLLLFEKKCQRLKQYRGKNGCSLASWIRVLTTRAVLDHLRRGTDALAPKRKAFALEQLPEMTASEPSAFEQLTVAELRAEVASGLKRLKPRDRLVIHMHCLEGQPLARVAQVLGISAQNIHSVKHRAIQRLRKVIIPEN